MASCRFRYDERIKIELKKMKINYDNNSKFIIKEAHFDKNISIVASVFSTETNSPYCNGIFDVKIICTEEYPIIKPHVICLTTIFHPNVYDNGEMFLFSEKEWSPVYGIESILLIIHMLLNDVDSFRTNYIGNEMAMNLYLSLKSSFCEIAKQCTDIYAIPAQIHVETNSKRTIENSNAQNDVPFVMDVVPFDDFEMDMMESNVAVVDIPRETETADFDFVESQIPHIQYSRENEYEVL
ncbi:putative ubiquitin-conjugating enzyme E2 S [Bodo saltans virus]|uniref:E2 ubiquitin-conjugating enzyme n=1 Tax=Bodo saltans virus TaxID=2024608 RepID=A0A2H4UTL1_9VIRU|nr:putative ubiquitin-conjugating enzyme E2 S [Bodo saltans virus]ATZ80228.1 putative ubiquitin-conjugating enzyme E2 S [Bodo saltans virus]